jgi:hypothetical protein
MVNYGKHALHMKLTKYYSSRPPKTSKQNWSMPLISFKKLRSLPNYIYPTPNPWDHLFFESFLLRLHFWELNTPPPPPPNPHWGRKWILWGKDERFLNEFYPHEFSKTLMHKYMKFISLGEFIFIHILFSRRRASATLCNRLEDM